MSFDVNTYEDELPMFGLYRRKVAEVVQQWERDKLMLYLSNLTRDQLDQTLPPNYADMSTDDLRKLTCLVVWGWGWEGSDYFVQMFK